MAQVQEFDSGPMAQVQEFDFEPLPMAPSGPKAPSGPTAPSGPKAQTFISKDAKVLNKAERKVFEQVMYGDLSKSNRKTRNAVEYMFTKGKKNFNIYESKSLKEQLEGLEDFIVIGTNGKASYAIVATNEVAIKDLHDYLNLCEDKVNKAIFKSFRHRIKHAVSAKQVADMLVEMNALSSSNQALQVEFDKLRTRMNEQMRKLPVKPTGKEDDVHISKRPEPKSIIFESYDFKEGAAGASPLLPSVRPDAGPC
jgi:regulator of replication initiation timing